MNKAQKEILLWFSRYIRFSAIAGTRLVARYFGNVINFSHVCGYPKSGTTWVTHMVAQYLGIPFVHVYYLPQTFQGQLHHHWDYHPSFDRSIYVIRDGRDVMISIYMNTIKNLMYRKGELSNLGKSSITRTLVNNIGHYSNLNRRMRFLFGNKFDPWDLKNNLPRFIEAEMQKPFIHAVNQTWPNHVKEWKMNGNQTVFVKYEELLDDCERTLSNTLEEFLNEEINMDDLTYAVDRYSFKRQTGRKPGEEDRTSFARKGIKDDWKNHFTKQACEVFDYYAGDLLVELEYETNRNWVDKFSSKL